ncbi:MAG: sulfurtransferase [marine bacterium B5-7]|nr:MAG: sulfurtransferase [marine bacterium B5-7]
MIIPVSKLVESAKSHCHCVDPVSAKIFYDQHDNAIIIDVREPGEAEASKLNDSTNIPRGVLEMKIEKSCPEADRPILLHCAAGGRASLSAHTLEMMGYSNVHVINATFDAIKSAFDLK